MQQIIPGDAYVYILLCSEINPFIAPACKDSGLKDALTRLQTVCFRSYSTSICNAVRFDESPFTCQCEEEDKKAEGFQVSHFYGLSSNDIMAVKELIIIIIIRRRRRRRDNSY